MKTIQILQTASIVIAILMVLFATLLMLVDPVAIMFIWMSLLFFLLAFNRKRTKLLKLYGFLFVASQMPFLFAMLNKEDYQHASSSGFPDFALFEKCSNEMFQQKENLNQPITESDQQKMAVCMGAEK